MLKRLSLGFMLLLALVGVAGVQAQWTAEPQSMGQYLPADTDLFFAIRTDGAFLDELSGVINGVVAKLPESVQAQAQMLDLKTLIESQVGPLSETGLGDYVAVGIANSVVIYDEDRTNDDEAVFYVAAALNDRAKFESFIDGMSPNTDKTTEDGMTVYTSDNDDMVRALVLDDVLYITNQTAVPTGETLADNSVFSETLSSLPEDSYNFLMYADFGPLFEMAMAQMPAESLDVFETMGLDMSEIGPIAIGGTILDEKSLVIDAYSPGFDMMMMPMVGAVDPAFAGNIPSGFSFVIHGTDLKTTLNATLDLLYQMNGAAAEQPTDA
ncbi:hypothetical protein HC776_01945 [bacterium]|nr:hypothetical protein [bacterium]